MYIEMCVNMYIHVCLDMHTDMCLDGHVFGECNSSYRLRTIVYLRCGVIWLHLCTYVSVHVTYPYMCPCYVCTHIYALPHAHICVYVHTHPTWLEGLQHMPM